MALDPISASIGAVGNIFGAVGGIISSGTNLKATKIQSAADRYVAGQITQQEYIKLQAQEENALSGTVNNLLDGQQKTDYLPYLLIGGIILVIIVSVSKSKA